MKSFIKFLVSFFLGINGWVICRGWIGIFLQNLSFVNLLMKLLRQNREAVVLVIFILSFSCTVVSLVSLFWAIRRIATWKSKK